MSNKPTNEAIGRILEKNVVYGDNVKVWHYCQIRAEAKIGDNTQIGSFSYIGLGCQIGKNCGIQSYAFIPHGVTLGNNVFVGPAATFTNDKNPKAQNPDWIESKTMVEDYASIGANATILPGIVIGKAALVGAGAVITKDVAAGSIVVGNPAKKIGEREIPE